MLRTLYCTVGQLLKTRRLAFLDELMAYTFPIYTRTIDEGDVLAYLRNACVNPVPLALSA
jgi:hypothetical protein